MIELAEWFIDGVAPFAEAAGWQPAHLFKPPRGLLFRWRSLTILGDKLTFPRRNYLGAQIGEHYFLYHAHRDGDVTITTGDERKRVLELAA